MKLKLRSTHKSSFIHEKVIWNRSRSNALNGLLCVNNSRTVIFKIRRPSTFSILVFPMFSSNKHWLWLHVFSFNGRCTPWPMRETLFTPPSKNRLRHNKSRWDYLWSICFPCQIQVAWFPMLGNSIFWRANFLLKLKFYLITNSNWLQGTDEAVSTWIYGDFCG